LPVSNHLYASLDAELLCSNFGQNYGIVLAKIKRKFFLAKTVLLENDQPKLSENFLRLEFRALSRYFLDTFEKYLGFGLVNQLVRGLKMPI